MNWTELWRLLGGYVRIRIQGYSPERFLNLCNFKGLDPWEIRCHEGDYELNLTLKGFRQIRPLVRKAGVRLVILEKRGLPFFLYKHRRRKLWVLGFGSFFILLYVMSLFLWEIEFQGNVRYSDDTLARCLKGQEIACGIPKSRIDCEKLEHELRSAFPEITWVSAQLSGPRLLIRIRENEAVSQPAEDEGEPADLVLFSLDETSVLDERTNRSKSCNSPYWNQPYWGKIKLTLCGGEIAYEDTLKE